MHRHQHLDHPGLGPLWASLEREWYQKLVALLLLQLGGLWLLYWSGEQQGAIMLFSLIGNATILLALIFHLRGPSELKLLKRLLYEQPHCIVWVYTLRTQYHPFGLQFLQQNLIYFKLENGSDISARLPAHRLRLVSRILQRALPNAVFGYRREWEPIYRERPETFPQKVLDRI